MMFIGILYACQRTFMALGRTKLSLIGAMMRKLVILLPLCFILPPVRLRDGRPALCGMHCRRFGLCHRLYDFYLEFQIHAQNRLTVRPYT